MPSAWVITLSDKGSQGLREDTSGPVVEEMLKQAGYGPIGSDMLPDETGVLESRLRELAGRADLIATTGGTGLSPRDITPEATLNVIERRVPGIPEAMRAYGMAKTPRAMLSRAEAGVLNGSLIINLPGSPKAARECLEAVIDTLGHAIDKMQGSKDDCARKD